MDFNYRSASIPQVPMHTPKSKHSQSFSQPSSRRSKQARNRALKLRKMYGLDRVCITCVNRQVSLCEHKEKIHCLEI